MKNLRDLKKTMLLACSVILFAGEGQASEELDKYAAEYPACVEVVKNQLVLFPVDQQVAIMPHLMKACMSGRRIGEKRTKKMYGIPDAEKPKKKSNLKIF